MTNLDQGEKKKLLAIFSKNLPVYRKSMKLSQEEFGELIGITRQTVSSIERGAYPLTWSIFLSCLFICSGQGRAKKLIFNSFAGEEELLGYLTDLMGDLHTGGSGQSHGKARQIFFGVLTIKDDPGYPIVEAEGTVMDMLGLSSEEINAGKSYLDYIYAEDREIISRLLDEKIHKQMFLCFEHRVVGSDGQLIPIQCYVRRQKKMMKNGLFDITITQVTGEMLKKRQVSGILTNLPVGVAVFCFQGRIGHDNVPEIYFANDAFYDTIGHTKDQFASIHNNYIADVVAPDDQKNVLRLFDPKNGSGETGEAEFRVNRFDGSVAWVHCNAVVVSRMEDGETLISCTFTEITQRINAEMSMKYQLDRYRQMEDASDDVQFGYDVENDDLTLPVRVARQLNRDGILHGFMTEDYPKKIVHPEDYDEFMKLYLNAKENAVRGKGEFRLKLSGTEFKWCRVSLITISNTQGNVVFIYGRVSVIDEERKILKEYSNDRMLINRLSSTDRLTGLYNRTAFRARLQEVLKDPEMDPVNAVIYCDINDFSYINEKYGYPAGDRMLRDFGAMFLRKGKKCFACRMHSDFFIVYLNGESKEQIIAKLRSWSKVFVEHQLKSYPGIDIQLTSGVYFMKKGENDIALAMDNANLARKNAKTENQQYCICTDELRRRRNYEQTISGEIANAIRDNRIEVFLQPKFDMKTREVIGAEALARWKNDDGTYRSPADFVPILEKTGHIIDLDFCIYSNVLQLLRKWKKNGSPMIPVSINFSKSNKVIANFDERLIRLAEQYDIDGKYVEIEINEAMLSEAGENSIFDNLQKKGFRLALDDFGSGSDSLSMLINAPVNTVKIGRHFLQRIGNSKRELNYVKAMCDMITAVRKEAVFEGVETDEQEQFLTSCGFSKAQGYLFERPIPLAEFEEKYMRSSENGSCDAG